MPVEVLLVEDNHSDVLLIKNIVAEFSLDVRITVAKDTQTAVALLFDPGFKPRLVITDMHMPRGVNVDLFKQAKAKGVPVVVFSSALAPTEIDEVMNLGAKECVVKPLAWDEFRDAVVGIFSRWVQRSS
jgi:DNA-binding NtrC family response regulator